MKDSNGSEEEERTKDSSIPARKRLSVADQLGSALEIFSTGGKEDRGGGRGMRAWASGFSSKREYDD
jgi:hypothetical protein